LIEDLTEKVKQLSIPLRMKLSSTYQDKLDCAKYFQFL